MARNAHPGEGRTLLSRETLGRGLSRIAPLAAICLLMLATLPCASAAPPVPPVEARDRLGAQARMWAAGEGPRATELWYRLRRLGLAPEDLLPLEGAELGRNAQAVLAEISSAGELPAGSGTTVHGPGGSNVARAFRSLAEAGEMDGIELVILTPRDDGLRGEIYRLLRRRKFRATTGPDEGIDTRSLSCYPGCIFVPVEEVDAISVAGWISVLRHEARHVEQLRHNPEMAWDFVQNGQRTVYAGFCEACADDGLYTTPVYYAEERMARLREVVGAENEPLVQRACRGDRAAYETLRALFDRLSDESGGFDTLFQPEY